MARTHEEFEKLIKEMHPNIELLGKYTKAVERVSVKCKTCGYEWSPKAYSLTQGKSCPHCSAIKGAHNNNGKTGLKNTTQFVDDMAKVHPDIVVLGEYVNGHTKILCKCSICEHEWSAMPYSLLQEHGCPRCAKSGTSFMEQFIKTSFEIVLGEQQVLSRDKSAIGMELDIYIPALNLAIEPGNWYLHQKAIKRDTKKREECKKKGIRLVTIYDKFPKNEYVPFLNDCFVFEDDLNKSDHCIIQKLVKDLLEISDIQFNFTDRQWQDIEKSAYENAKAQTHDDFVDRIKRIHPNVEVLGHYFNSSRRIRVRCLVCGYEWDGVPANMIAGDGCRKCGIKLAHQKRLKTQEKFIEEVEEANSDIEVIGTYIGDSKPVRARCKICGLEWEPIASSLLRGSSHKGSKTIHKKLTDNKLHT